MVWVLFISLCIELSKCWGNFEQCKYIVYRWCILKKTINILWVAASDSTHFPVQWFLLYFWCLNIWPINLFNDILLKEKVQKFLRTEQFIISLSMLKRTIINNLPGKCAKCNRQTNKTKDSQGCPMVRFSVFLKNWLNNLYFSYFSGWRLKYFPNPLVFVWWSSSGRLIS